MADKTQDYKVTLVFKNKGDKHPTDWIHLAMERGWFATEVATHYSAEVEAIDRSQEEWSWLDNIDSLNGHIQNNTALKAVQEQKELVQSLQNSTHSPSNWTQYEEELVDLRNKLEKLEKWHNQVSNSKET